MNWPPFVLAALMADEEWKPIHEFPGYEISSFGRVKSLARQHCRPNHAGNGMDVISLREKIINGWVRLRGASPMVKLVALRRDGTTYHERVHRLVLTAFVGPCPEGMEGCHNDGNPENNAVLNLRWDTHHENMLDQIKHGTKSKPPTFYGEQHHAVTIPDSEVAVIRRTVFTRGVQAQLARKYGVAQITISRIRQRLSR